MFALVDCNNFYVSCETVFNPGLAGKPVVVLSNNDGCIISRSDEAKKLGLKMGEPIFKNKQFVIDNKVIVLSSNYTLYGDMSARVMEQLKQFTPSIEIYSIDECFLELSLQPGKLIEYAKKIKKTVEQNTGIPVCVGIAETKTLAKMANKTSKSNPIHDGIFHLKTKREIDCILRNTSIHDIWGIGRQYHSLMLKNNIHTAWDFSQVNNQWIKNKMSVVGIRMKNELLGIPCIPIEMIITPKKAIATTRAFGKKLTNPEYIREAVATYASRCAEKLRKQGTRANILTVFIHTDPFAQNEKYVNKSKTINLPVATNNHAELVHYAIRLLNLIFVPGLRYKKAGVIVDGLEPDTHYQANVFDCVDRTKQKVLMTKLDKINLKYGKDTVKLSVQGSGKNWKLKQEKLSRKYTTRLSDIININA